MNSRNMRYRVTGFYRGYASCLIVLVALASWCGHAMGQGEWRPLRNVELVVQAGAGGASDRTARTMQRIMQDKRLIESPATVVNKVGGGGAVAYNYVNQHAGDAHFVLMTSGTLMSSYVIGQSPFRHTDFTPLAILCSEYTVFVVRADSAFKDGKALLARLVSSPQDVRIALSPGLGNANHIALAMVVKAAGGDVKRLKVAVFASSAETVTALLGGHVDLVLAPASPVLPHVAASTVRVLAVSSAQRLPGGLASAPTWKEMGVDGVFGNWRGVFGPKGLAEPQVAYWSGVFSRLAATPEWKEDLDKNLLSPLFIGGAESRQFLDAEHKQISALMKDIGLAK
jgi:putative tricarboxylic transport membrane protein